MTRTFITLTALLLATTALPAADLPQSASSSRIDRQTLVSRHNVTLHAYDKHNPLQVGNGHFAFALDVTGLPALVQGRRKAH